MERLNFRKNGGNFDVMINGVPVSNQKEEGVCEEPRTTRDILDDLKKIAPLCAYDAVEQIPDALGLRPDELATLEINTQRHLRKVTSKSPAQLVDRTYTGPHDPFTYNVETLADAQVFATRVNAGMRKLAESGSVTRWSGEFRINPKGVKQALSVSR